MIEVIGSGVTDLQGHSLPPIFFVNFTTGLGAVTTAPSVVQVSPGNGASGVPVNPQVVVVMSTPVNAVSVGSSAITVSAGGTEVSGAISLSSDRTTLTFVPTNLLATSTTYMVTVGGFTDQAGNPVTPFTSTFTTGATGVANKSNPTVAAVSPGNGATGVTTNSAIVLTFNEAINAATVNNITVPIIVNGFGGDLAGSYAVDPSGKVVTFTPLSPLPANSQILVEVNGGVVDLSGNSSSFFESSFTTGGGTDTTAPVVAMVTPGNGATGIGLNAAVVLTFSKPLNPSTINSNTVGLLVDGNKLGMGINVSADNRVVTLNAGVLPASSTVTVAATPGVMDLSGNSLVSFVSTFTTAGGFDTTHPAWWDSGRGTGRRERR